MSPGNASTMSCSMHLNDGRLRTALRLYLLPVWKLSSATTSYPSASSRSHRCEPRNPAPPATRARRRRAPVPCVPSRSFRTLITLLIVLPIRPAHITDGQDKAPPGHVLADMTQPSARADSASLTCLSCFL